MSQKMGRPLPPGAAAGAKGDVDPLPVGAPGELFGPGRMNRIHAERSEAAQSIARRMTVWRKPAAGAAPEADAAAAGDGAEAGVEGEAAGAEGAEAAGQEAAPEIGAKLDGVARQILRMPKWTGGDPDADDKPQRGAKGASFRGGGKGTRDNHFGINDNDFWKWWEQEKQKTGGKDLETKAEADAQYKQWVGAGKPKVNK